MLRFTGIKYVRSEKHFYFAEIGTERNLNRNCDEFKGIPEHNAASIMQISGEQLMGFLLLVA